MKITLNSTTPRYPEFPKSIPFHADGGIKITNHNFKDGQTQMHFKAGAGFSAAILHDGLNPEMFWSKNGRPQDTVYFELADPSKSVGDISFEMELLAENELPESCYHIPSHLS